MVEKVQESILFTLYLIYFGGWDVRLPSSKLEIVLWVLCRLRYWTERASCGALLEKRSSQLCRLLQARCSWAAS